MRGIFHRIAVLLILVQSAGALLLPLAASATALPPAHVPNKGNLQFTSTIAFPQLTGHVVNGDGSPLTVGAHVEAMRFGVVVARAEIDATSDADAGSYGMIISPGVYVIKFVDGPASHPAYDLVIPGVNIAPTRLLDATLARASSHLVS